MSSQINFDNWVQVAYGLHYEQGKSYEDIIPLIRHIFPGKSDIQIYERLRKRTKQLLKKYQGDTTGDTTEPKAMTDEEAIKSLLGGVKKEKIAEDQVERLRTEGYKIADEGDSYKIDKTVGEFTQETNEIILPWQNCELIRFALIADTHINSKYTQLTYLHEFYDLLQRKGINTVYHCGDIDEGEQMRVGHQYECYTQGADDHVAEIVRVYPKRDGIKTYFITGNHDASIIKRCGYDIGYAIAAKRDDMVYLGSNEALIHLTPNCTLELRHPWDGTAYSISYKVQKMIDAMSGGTKPNILAIGHYHKAEYLFYRNVHAFQAGCFQSDTPFTRGKGISVHTGGWIINVTVEKDTGYIRSINPTFIPYYVGVKEDYKKWAGFGEK